MKLEFYDLNELDAFLAWAGRGRIGSASDIGSAPVAYEFAPAFEGAFTPVTGEVNAPAATSAEGKPKRTRRTKAEIEAGVTVPATGSAPAPVEEADKNTGGAPGETPAQAAIRQALEAAALRKQAKAAGDTELAHAAESTSALSPTDPKLLPHEFIQKRAAELGEMQAIEHLNAARNFIAKHGMAKYNESFPLCGLHANVMQFAPAECATHAAALEWLDKA